MFLLRFEPYNPQIEARSITALSKMFSHKLKEGIMFKLKKLTYAVLMLITKNINEGSYYFQVYSIT
jgi:hypothetical protein